MNQPESFQPRIVIDPQTRFRLEQLVAPELGYGAGSLCHQIRNILIGIGNSNLDVRVVDFTKSADRKAKRICLGVIVNGIPDQGLIFGQREPVTAN